MMFHTFCCFQISETIQMYAGKCDVDKYEVSIQFTTLMYLENSNRQKIQQPS